MKTWQKAEERGALQQKKKTKKGKREQIMFGSKCGEKNTVQKSNVRSSARGSLSHCKVKQLWTLHRFSKHHKTKIVTYVDQHA